MTSARRDARRHAAASGAALVAVLALAGCARDDGTIRGSGTIEMDEIDVASVVGGHLVHLAVSEGDSVQAGDTLAVLDQGEVAAQLAARAAEAERAASQARDLQQGARPAELVIARENLRAAEAELELARVSFERTEKLAKAAVAPPADLDRARTALRAAEARAAAAREEVRLQEEGFRRAQVLAAKQGAAAAAAQLAGARSRADELLLVAPRAGVVLLTNYEAGELVAPGSPVVTLGDPDSLWMRVYVAAPSLPRLRLGAEAEVRPIGASRPYGARVASIASQAEFTPRAALTEEEQANLVFGVKLVLAPNGRALKAGLPADARIRPAP
jgi:HlyD family secretion protein